ncbi:MAG: response regulator [Lachnospiraceae bacterium]|nr:response regulator [Lachnospiraceae bacterium]
MKKAKKSRILVVDDENTNLVMLKHILSPEYHVYASTNGEDAIEAAAELLPDIILLDIVMPGLDGYDVISKLKIIEGTKNIPVIFLTGMTTPEDEIKGLNYGAVDYIFKPFSRDLLLKRIEIHLLLEAQKLSLKLYSNALEKTVAEKSRAMEQAKLASKAKSDFLSTMSHEIRTPMNAIIGLTAIGKKTRDIDEIHYSLNKIDDASSHLLGIINDILDMAKIEADKLELSPVEFIFDRLIQKVTPLVNFRIDEKQQILAVNIDQNIPRFLIGDDQRLAQVIMNLMGNAVKFTPVGGKILFSASLIKEDDNGCELEIEVSDNGIGIPPKKQEKLFNMFEQAESGTSREYGGTGLGLAISKRIVELMGGRIWVESEPDKGSRFIFRIKAKRGDTNPRSLLAPGVNWESVRILVVDDLSETRTQFSEMFGQLNISCDLAKDGLEACRLIEERGEYDIYFVDWQMPGMNGIELTKHIKSLKGRPSVVVMITSMDWEQIKGDAIKAGIDKHLLKPLFSSSIIDYLNEYLGAVPGRNTDIENVSDLFEGKKMLLAEDVEINREILIALLKDTGLDIDCAENGEEALNKIKAAPDKYDIIFMDVQMPKMDGYEATRNIRALPDPHITKLPVIAMTANVFKSDIDECISAGMDDHLGKPLDIGRVMEVLRSYLKK